MNVVTVILGSGWAGRSFTHPVKAIHIDEKESSTTNFHRTNISKLPQ
jgi:hypothetical protein